MRYGSEGEIILPDIDKLLDDYVGKVIFPEQKPKPNTRQPWQCPSCGKFYAPWVNECFCEFRLRSERAPQAKDNGA